MLVLIRLLQRLVEWRARMRRKVGGRAAHVWTEEEARAFWLTPDEEPSGNDSISWWAAERFSDRFHRFLASPSDGPYDHDDLPEEFGDLSEEEARLVAAQTADVINHTLARLFVRLGPPPEATSDGTALSAPSGGGGAAQ